MPIIVPCPKCNGQLRVADNLIGRKVRCPACSTTFDAVQTPPPPAVEKVPPWRNLDLQLGSDPPPTPPAEKNPGPPLKGAVEINLSLDDPESRPPSDAPRLPVRNDREDLRACPGCGKRIDQDAKRCPECGERFEDEDEDYPRRRPRRRDWEPHRGGMILTFGIISVATLFVCPPLLPIALVFGVAAWWMGGSDLRKIQAGTMDPDGREPTQAGWICGIIGVCLNGILVLGCGGFLGVMWYDDMQRANQVKRPPFAPPPGMKRR